MKQSFVTEPSVTIVEAEGDISEEHPHAAEFDVPKGSTHAVVLVEHLAGPGKVTLRLDALTSEEREELSRLEQVRLRFVRLAGNAQTLSLQVASTARVLVRVTVAFVKREATSLRKNFSCRACKQLCRMAISALLAHLGIPYLGAEAAVDMPDVAPPNETSGMGRPLTSLDDLLKRTQGAATVPVEVGAPVPLGAECRALLEQPETAPAWLREMFDLIDPQAFAAVRGVLKVLDWVFDAPDRIYTAVCTRLRMCQPTVA